jgi:hypothetical protein
MGVPESRRNQLLRQLREAGERNDFTAIDSLNNELESLDTSLTPQGPSNLPAIPPATLSQNVGDLLLTNIQTGFDNIVDFFSKPPEGTFNEDEFDRFVSTANNREFNKAGLISRPRNARRPTPNNGISPQTVLDQVSNPESNLRRASIQTADGGRFEFEGNTPVELIDPQVRQGETPIQGPVEGFVESATPQPEQGRFLNTPNAGRLLGQLAQAVSPQGTIAHSLGAVGEGRAANIAQQRYLELVRNADDPSQVEIPGDIANAITADERLKIDKQVQEERLNSIRQRHLEALTGQAAATTAATAPFERRFQHEKELKLLGNIDKTNLQIRSFKDQGNEVTVLFNPRTGDRTEIGRDWINKNTDKGITANQAINNAFKFDMAIRRRVAQTIAGEFGDEVSIIENPDGPPTVTFNNPEAQAAYENQIALDINFEQGVGNLPAVWLGHQHDSNIFKEQFANPGRQPLMNVGGAAQEIPEGFELLPNGNLLRSADGMEVKILPDGQVEIVKVR